MAIRNTGILNDSGRPWSTKPIFDFKNGLQRRIGKYNDPTYLGFFLMFQPNSPLLDAPSTSGDPGTPGTAYYYLNKIGEKTRAKYIIALSEIIRDINHNMPWYWQSIEGLENAFKYKNAMDSYVGGDDAKITINTLESIDLKISQIIELYRQAAYDFKYRREILPENLRKFRLWIWVSEMRKFQNAEMLDKSSKETLDITNDNVRWMLFRLDECEFITDESNPYLSTLSFAEPAMASNKLVIQYQNTEYDYGPNLAEDILSRLNIYEEEDEKDFKDIMASKAKK